MASPRIVQGPEPLLRTQCELGEGCVWDTRVQRLYFLDILRHRVYTYEPSSGIWGFETFSEPIGCIALREDGEGLIAAALHTFVFIPSSSLPFPPTSSTTPRPLEHLTPPIPRALHAQTARFNDGACDARGAFLCGTIGKDEEREDGVMWMLEPLEGGRRVEDVQGAQGVGEGEMGDENAGGSVRTRKLLDGCNAPNGAGWSPDGKTFYWTDSRKGTIFTFAYDPYTSALDLLSRKVFHCTAPPYNGTPDGLCMDDQGGIWSARWQDSRVVRFAPDGTVTDEVRFPHCGNMTCCVFGGPDLDELYVTSASSRVSGDHVGRFLEGGDVYVVRGLGYRGVERGRYRG